MKKLIQKLFNSVGFTLRKTPFRFSDLDQYLKIYGEESVQKKSFYNIGAGSFNHPAWTNIDKISEWYSTNNKNTFEVINFDLFSMDPLPIADKFAEIVYTSHTIEHIHDDAAQHIFEESFRILKDGGIFRITTPNIDLALLAPEIT